MIRSLPPALASILLVAGAAAPASSQEVLAGRRAAVVYWPGDSSRAARLADLLEGQPSLPGLPSTVPTPPVRVLLAPSEAVFDSLLGDEVPEWGAGVAVPSARTIVIPGFASERTRFSDPVRVLRHEWAHLALHDFLAPLRIPRWFDEGFAEWASGGWDVADGWRLRVAFALRRAPPLDSLALAFPRDAASARLAYLLSATTVEYLVARSGEAGLARFLGLWKELESFERALRTTYGVTSAQLEEDWRKYVKRRYGWLFVLSHSALFWLGAAVLLLLLVWIRRRRDRRRLARLRATEPPERPAYWMPGDEDP